MRQNDKKTWMIVEVGVLAALATAMFMFLPEIPLFGNHLKLDVSDLPALLAAVITGPFSGFLIEIIKNVIHLTKTTTFGIGEVMNIIVGGAMVYSFSWCYRWGKRMRKSGKALDHGAYVFAVICMTAATVAAGFAANLVFSGPYLKILHLDVSFPVILGYATASIVLNVSKALMNGILIYPIAVALKKYIRADGRS